MWQAGQISSHAPEGMEDLFGEYWAGYPQVSLCRFHHMIWHGIVTPGLVAEADELVRHLRIEGKLPPKRNLVGVQHGSWPNAE